MKQQVSGINNKKPLISIVTATYNCERYIDECLNSVASQKSNDFLIEHIVIDGLSSDNTVEILNKHKDVKWVSEADKGQSDGLNKGFLMAKGDWIMVLDGDDYLLPGSLKLFHKAIKKENVDIVYGHIKFVDENSKMIRKVISTPYHFEYIVYGLAMPPSCGLLIRADFLKLNLLNTDHHYNMDTEWFLRCGESLKSKVVIGFTTAFRFWGENKTSPLFFGNELPKEIKQERYILDKTYMIPYKKSVSKFGIFRYAHYCYFKLKYYLSKVIFFIRLSNI